MPPSLTPFLLRQVGLHCIALASLEFWRSTSLSPDCWIKGVDHYTWLPADFPCHTHSWGLAQEATFSGCPAPEMPESNPSLSPFAPHVPGRGISRSSLNVPTPHSSTGPCRGRFRASIQKSILLIAHLLGVLKAFPSLATSLKNDNHCQLWQSLPLTPAHQRQRWVDLLF